MPDRENDTFDQQMTRSTQPIQTYRVDGDTYDRFIAYPTGKMEWGTGAAAIDLNLYRTAAGILKTDNSLDIGAGILQNAAQLPTTVTFAAAAGAANVCEVTITLKDGLGATVASPVPFLLWLSDAASGAGLTATTASGAVTAKGSAGADFGAITTKKAFWAQPLATGVFILSITDTSKTGFYVCAKVPFLERVVVSAQLVTGNYG
jgi:hypothetical protein